ncbi:MAG: hypothetical protein KatS3mg119_2069 [Rhodothalassiaceae bacterium]|nr:MAG: hypothetical protein KatS3mg119_2069 [Rhodothalassiaceae bacterium]
MRRLAIFADAGYLYAEGSRCALGRRRERRHLRIVPEAVISALKEIGRQAVPEAYLLRIYWYDGLIAGRPSAEQSAIAALPDVKMRFGYVNNAGRQKGVDTRIVTDLVELARNQAITDAILVSGDEDLRVGVEIAQSFGIRVHLLGIQPAAGSQSRTLRDEADTVLEWSPQQVATWLQERSEISESGAMVGGTSPPPASDQKGLKGLVESVVAAIEPEVHRQLLAQARSADNEIPRDIDGRLLAAAGQSFGRKLSAKERGQMRRLFWEAVRARAVEE